MKISLIHPSRGRPQKSLETCKRWVDRSGYKDIQIVISIDRDDSARIQYIENARDLELYVLNNELKFPLAEYDGSSTRPIAAFSISHSNKSVVEATNRAVRQAHGDIFIYLSDDFDCPENWGPLIIKEFEGVTTPQLIKVDDCLQPFRTPVLTIPIMNRQLYERLGYFWHPSYKSMFVDEDLFWTTRKLKALKYCQHLKFEHKHVSVGKAQDDETYRRSAANWTQGEQVFLDRKQAGFPV